MLDSGVPYHTQPGPGLTEVGEGQAETAARLLEHAGIERIVSSPWKRCTQTATPLCEALRLELALDDDLGEMGTREPGPEMGLRMLRAALAQCDADVVALISHAAPLEQLLHALTRGKVVLPPADARGARFHAGQVWQLLRHDGEWHAQHMREGGVPA